MIAVGEIGVIIIYLYSGREFPNQVVLFHVATENFTDYGESGLTIDFTGTYYPEVNAQINDVLFVPGLIDGDILTIYVFNLSSNEFNIPILNISAPSTNGVVKDGCLAATDDHQYLYMLLPRPQRYSISNSTWTELPPMNTERVHASCIIDQDNYLWAIGGHGYKSMEKILVTGISDGAQWNLNVHELMDAVFGRKAVLYDQAIYLVGGELGMDHLGNSLYMENMTMINTITGEVFMLSNKFNYAGPSAYFATGLVDHTIYVFGGRNSDYSHSNTWLKLIGLAPTISPTRSPSQAPVASINPSMFPTSNPSQLPSEHPTFAPSIVPTVNTTVPISFISNETNPGNPREENVIVYVIAIGSSLLLCTILLCTCLYLRSKKIEPIAQETQQNKSGTKLNIIPSNSHNPEPRTGKSAKLRRNTTSSSNGYHDIEEKDIIAGDPDPSNDMEIEQDNDNMIIRTKGNDNENDILKWLNDKVGLPQYINNFLLNGFDSLDMIKNIDDEEMLKEIEITEPPDINTILSEIQRLIRSDEKALQVSELVIISNINTDPAHMNPVNDQQIREIKFNDDEESIHTDAQVMNVLDNNFEGWGYTEIVEWIMKLENGLFKEYENIVRQYLKNIDLKGTDLVNIEEEDINDWGIDKFKHVKLIYSHVKALTNVEGNAYQPEIDAASTHESVDSFSFKDKLIAQKSGVQYGTLIGQASDGIVRFGNEQHSNNDGADKIQQELFVPSQLNDGDDSDSKYNNEESEDKDGNNYALRVATGIVMFDTCKENEMVAFKKSQVVDSNRQISSNFADDDDNKEPLLDENNDVDNDSKANSRVDVDDIDVVGEMKRMDDRYISTAL